MLYLVATPLGNLGDITVRSLRTLEEVDVIFSEDTRRSRILLSHYGIDKPLKRYDENRAIEGSPLERALREQDVAFISDAGMPIISDPGFELISFCLEEAIDFEVQPGASAFSLALVASNLPSHSFVFGGFLPRKKSERIERLNHYKDYRETLIFYETPHRIVASLRDALEVLGRRPACLSREMTKIYEEHLRMDLGELLAELEENPRKGEMVLLIQGCQENGEEVDYEGLIDRELERGTGTKEIATIVSKALGISGSEAYRLVLERKGK